MKRSNYILLCIFSACSLLLFNAFKEDAGPCIKGEGAAVTQNRGIDGVSRISLQSHARLNITRGNAYSCSVNAQQNILDNLIFDREGDKLIIHHKKCVTGDPKITINITLPSLTMVKLGGSGEIHVAGEFHVPSFEAGVNGSGDIYIDNPLVAGSLAAEVSGSGNISMNGTFKKAENRVKGSGSISISGSCDNNNISISGSGEVHAFDLSTLSTNVRTSGSGNAEVNAKNTLDASISGSGDISYRGNPAVTKHINGSGTVVKK